MYRRYPTSKPRDQGFSLIEVAIVMLVIGLVVGGIVVGKTLIKNAEIRAVISQKQTFDTAVYTFETKYGALPGDISSTHAAQRGLFAITPDPINYPSENGIINTFANNDDCCVGEGLTFWRHLSEAGLLADNYGRNTDNPLDTFGRPTTTTTNASLFLPSTKMHNFSMLVIGAGPTSFGFQRWAVSHNYYYFRQPTLLLTHGFMSSNWVSFSPIEAHTIDTKMDDGMPNTGKVLNGKESWTNSNANWNAAPADGNCTYGGSGDHLSADVQYNIDENNGGNSNTYADPNWGMPKYICDIYLEFE